MAQSNLKRYNVNKRIEDKNRMENPSSDNKDQTAHPAPEVLVPRSEEPSTESVATSKSTEPKAPRKARHNTYRPSHKGTFIGLAVVVAVLAINAGIIGFVLKSQSKNKGLSNQGQVTISQGALDKLGVNRSSIGNLGIELVVSPDARFNGKVTVGGSVNVAGQLKINSKFSAGEASLTQLEAGKTSLSQLDVNGDSTLSALNLRNNLTVTGTTRLQGPVTITQLLTVNNNLNVAGNLAVGGVLSVNALSTHSLVLDSTLTVGGHIITRGSAPNVGAGGAVGNNGTVSISGNDASGTVAVNVGTGASGGVLANIAFRNQYGNIPHVVITPIGAAVGSFYVSRSVGGFSISVAGGLSPGGYAFDYIVEQ